MNTVSFNKYNTVDFAKAYNKARSAQEKTFLFEGGEYVIDYAYYLLQHLVNEKLITGTFDDKKIFKVNFKPENN